MIDPNKTYRTRDGRPVRIYAVDGGGSNPVHGAVKDDMGWFYHGWAENGQSNAFERISSNVLDLVEVTLADKITEHIPWEALRPDIQWVAMNNDGIWFGYTNQPGTSQESRYWSAAINTLGWPLAAVNMPSVKRHRWRETLCKRPENR